MEAISIREYARQRGCSDTAIHKMIKAGIITPASITSNPKNGRPMIIADKATSDIEAYASNSSRVLNKVKAEKPKPEPKPRNPIDTKNTKRTRIELPDDEIPPPPPTPPGTLPDGGKSKAELDRLLATLKVKKAALEVKQLEGTLVEKDKVRQGLFEIGQVLKKDILSIPDKTIDNIRAAKTRQEAHSMLYQALSDALTAISNIKPSDLNFKTR